MSDRVTVKVDTPHDPALTYHEWVYVSPIAVNKRGVPNPRMYVTDWQFWRCNNTDCPGQALVSNEIIRAAIDAWGTR